MKVCLPRILAPLVAAGLVACAHGVRPPAPPAIAPVSAARGEASEYDNRLAQLHTDARLGHRAEAVADMTLLAQRWPDRVRTMEPESVLWVVNESYHLPRGAALPLLQALYDAHWKLRYELEPSELWLRLTRLLLERGEVAEAIQVSLRITKTHDLIAMRSDRRFDAVVAANPGQFDIEAAATRELRTLQAASEKAPQSLGLKSDVLEALLQQQHYAAMLALSDDVLLDIRSTNFPEKLYSDFNEKKGSFLNQRAVALERFGRWDEAVEQLTAATVVKERGRNVDQLINLGELYCALERPRDALSAIAKVSIANLNSYGVMEMEAVRLDAALQLGDTKEAQSALEYLRDNRAEDPFAYQDALVTMDRLDDAAHFLIERLRDADQRLQALSDSQTYVDPPTPPRDALIRSRERALLARPDVQAEIHEVGRIERYPVEE
jgi:beta-barrel assembly-enhancing protease